MPPPNDAAAVALDGVPGSAWLWQNRGFNTYWFGRTMSALGSSLLTIALPLVVIEVTGSIQRLGTLMAIFSASALVTGVTAGPLVDRLERRRLMIAADLGRAIALCAVPVLWWLSTPRFWPLVLVALVGGGLTTLSQVAGQAFLPALVGKPNLSRANARLEITFALVFVAGPALAGSLSPVIGSAAVVGCNGIMYGISAMVLTQVPPVAQQPANERTAARGLGDSFEGLRALYGMPFLRWVVPLDAGVVALCAVAPNLIIFYLKQVLGQGPRTVGLVFGAMAVGAIIAGLSISWLRGRVGFRPLWLVCLTFTSLTFIAGGFASVLAATIAVGVLFSMMQTARSVLVNSIRQELIPDALQGRVGSAVWTLNLTLVAASNVGLTALAGATGVPSAFMTMGAIASVVALAAVLTPGAARHPAPAFLPAAAAMGLDGPDHR